MHNCVIKTQNDKIEVNICKVLVTGGGQRWLFKLLDYKSCVKINWFHSNSHLLTGFRASEFLSTMSLDQRNDTNYGRCQNTPTLLSIRKRCLASNFKFRGISRVS